MPERETLRRARADKRAGQAPSTLAGEFVREEIHHVREGKHGAASTKQAIAITPKGGRVMRGSHIAIPILLVASLIGTGACSRAKTPAAEVARTTGEQPRAEPMTVTGCLGSGAFAENVWVLMVPSTPGGAPASTVHLIGGDPATLRSNAGRQVEVSGTLQAREQIATSGTTSLRHRASGAPGSPAVQTDTQIEIKRLAVGTIRPTGEKCPSHD